jgi:hypothetical protein
MRNWILRLPGIPVKLRQRAILVPSSFMNASAHSRHFSSLLLGGFVACALVAPAIADHVSREQDIIDLKLGQRIQVDDGTCPPGQIKEISGTRMTATGILRAQKCIPRLKK